MKLRVYQNGLIEKIDNENVVQKVQLEEKFHSIYAVSFFGNDGLDVEKFHDKQSGVEMIKSGSFKDFTCSENVRFVYVNYNAFKQAIFDLWSGKNLVREYDNSPIFESKEIKEVVIDKNLMKIFVEDKDDFYYGKIKDDVDAVDIYTTKGNYLCSNTRKFRRTNDLIPSHLYYEKGESVGEVVVGDKTVIVVRDKFSFEYDKVFVINQNPKGKIIEVKLTKSQMQNLLNDYEDIKDIDIININNIPYIYLEGKKGELAMLSHDGSLIAPTRNYISEAKKSIFKKKYEARKQKKKEEIQESFALIANCIEARKQTKIEEVEIKTQIEPVNKKHNQDQTEEDELGDE